MIVYQIFEHHKINLVGWFVLFGLLEGFDSFLNFDHLFFAFLEHVDDELVDFIQPGERPDLVLHQVFDQHRPSLAGRVDKVAKHANVLGQLVVFVFAQSFR